MTSRLGHSLRRLTGRRQPAKSPRPRQISSRFYWERTFRACIIPPSILALLIFNLFLCRWLSVTSFNGQLALLLVVTLPTILLVVPYAVDIWGPQYVKNRETKPKPQLPEAPPTAPPGPASRPSGLAEH